ncbi:MAG TPA: hypothetical protein VFL95_07825 [Gemmatimonadales bacterium]|nr:hypothetical protein [Gemmatimonadales bacterium]
MKTIVLGATVSTLLSLAAPLSAQRPFDVTPYLMTDRAAELALARSAAPSAITDSATVMVLTRTGFVQAAQGTNGFTCVVLRSFSGSVNDPGFWDSRVRAPLCFNPPAARTVLPAMLATVKLLLSGAAPADAAAQIRKAYAAHQYPSPAPGAMAYMLSPRQWLGPGNPHWMPHFMFFFDHSLPAADWGAKGDMTAPVIDGSANDPQAPVLTLLIPVRQWSDGTTALAANR